MMREPRVVALGFFDGVHIGHGALLNETLRLSRLLGARSCALTFDRHPETLICGQPMPLINTLDDRITLIKRYGVEEVLVEPFDKRLMQMPWPLFVDDILIEQYSAVAVVAGHDYRFGYMGQGDAATLSAYGQDRGLTVSIQPRIEIEGITVSSTYIRTLIAQGELRRAGRFLGHPHILSGVVMRGQQLGGSLGAPTVNLLLPDGVQCPAMGVYAALVEADGQVFRAATNVGVRPTVSDSGPVWLESHLLDFNGNLYGETVCVTLLHFLRPERKFPDLSALAAQIGRDLETARQFFQDEAVEG